MITKQANFILNKDNYPDTPPRTVGPDWTRRFLKRHKEYSEVKQRSQEVDRTFAATKAEVLEWFQAVKQIIDENGLTPYDIWNFDESGFRIGVGKDQKVITKYPKRRAYLPSVTERENVTLIEAISAAGAHIPPYIILKGQVYQAGWAAAEMPHGYTIVTSESGYTNDEIALH